MRNSRRLAATCAFALLYACNQPPSLLPEQQGKPVSFSVPSLGGASAVDISAFRGKVILIDFWASWCAPCKASFPYYQALAAKHGEANLVIIAVSVDDEVSDALAFAKSFATPASNFLLAHDAGQVQARRFAIPNMPTLLFVDKAGNLRGTHQGFDSKAPVAIEGLLDSLLAE